MIRINTFSKLSSLSIRTLRHYDEIELLKPYYVDEDTNYRYYSSDQLRRANQIIQLKNIGFSLKDIKNILDESDMEMIQLYLSMRKKEIEKELKNIEIQSQLLDKISKTFNDREDNKFMNYSVMKKEIPARKVISVKKVVSSYQDEGMLWEILGKELKKQKVKISSNPCAMAIYHDDEYKDSDVCIEVLMSVSGDYEDSGDVVFYDADELQVASVTFGGSYEQVPQVVESIAYWVENNNHVIAGPMINIFHVSPSQDKDPNNWITESGYVIK